MAPPDLSVLIVNYNTAHLFPELFDAIERARGTLQVQVVVVDNASRDDSLARLAADYPDVEVIASATNVGFGRANNLALPRLKSDLVLLLNTDAFVAADTLERTVGIMRSNPDVGVLGVRLVGRSGEAQPSFRFFPTPLSTFAQAAGLLSLFPWVQAVDGQGFCPAQLSDCDWVPGCYYLTRRAVIESCGLFDPRYFLYFEEVDHCRAVKAAGWRVVCEPHTSVIHIGGESARSDGELSNVGRQLSGLQAESEWLYVRKHHGLAGALLHLVLCLLLAALLATKALAKACRDRRYMATVPSIFADLRLRLRIAGLTRMGRLALH